VPQTFTVILLDGLTAPNAADVDPDSTAIGSQHNPVHGPHGKEAHTQITARPATGSDSKFSFRKGGGTPP
jgi:hypothetical protein